MSKIKRIVFMGTPDFAVPTLASLVESEFDVVGVITAPDKPAGRGKRLRESPVKQFAQANAIKILQPTNLKNPEFQEELKELKADIQVVVAFRMLPVAVWSMPPLGSINLHGSLLPQYRGAAPIHWAVINGERETGLSTFFLQHEIDTGKIIYRVKTAIGRNETTGDLHDRLMIMGADLVLKTIRAVNAGDYPQEAQDHITDIKHAPKIHKEDCRIDWTKPVQVVHNFIRGMSPFPGAFTTLDEQTFKIYRCEISETSLGLQAGELLINRNELLVGCTDGVLKLNEVQLQGKKRMDTLSFLNGYTINSDRLG